MFSQTTTSLPDSDVDEFDRYLADSCVQTADPLAWWLMNRKVYPNLAKLAISVHTSMGTRLLYSVYNLTNMFFLASSVAIERSFSRGHILISHL